MHLITHRAYLLNIEGPDAKKEP